jgi:hypothetical protein
MDKEWGVKSPPKEKSNNSMNIDEVGSFKDRRQVLLTSCSYFTILTLLFLALKFLKAMSKTIANNAITPTTNHPLSPLRGIHTNLVH